MSAKRVTGDELRKHNKASDCWVAIHGRVYDVTRFLADHPGGGEVISSLAGSETTSEFEDIGHSDAARRDAAKYFVGLLEGSDPDASDNIPLLAQLSKQPIAGIDTRLVILSGALAVAAAVASFYVFSNKRVV
jgi:cytochrome b5